MADKIDKLIINSPYEEPSRHWFYIRESREFELRSGRRPAGYIMATPNSRAFDDPGIFILIKLVELIRPRVKTWRENGYPGATGITKRLLSYWYDLNERTYRRFFFCQLEAIETLIWLTEAPDAEKTGIEIPSDGGAFVRWCCKMATGSGKTIVMAMLIAWQVLNKVVYPQDKRFSKNILVIAPGLTVKSRLSVLNPFATDNYYDEFNILPPSLYEKLRQGKIIIQNWHQLNWETEDQLAKKKSVDKRGVKSDEAYVREVLGEMANSRNIVVINDEAHHAWRVPAESKEKGIKREDIEESTIWIGGLDRIHHSRGILTCFDFSATPFAPSGKKSTEEHLFPWIVSDFGLNDAIESGLVKTPRVVVRDDGRLTSDYKSRLYHIYMDDEVRDDINRKAEETESLPDLVTNAYYLLGKDWLETKKLWEQTKHKVPPVMITVANRTETAARIKFTFDHQQVLIPELCDSEKILHIDSKVLKMAEEKDEAINLSLNADDDEAPESRLTKLQQAELLRKKVDTVGKSGEIGEQVQNVISVGMLSEGWDAKTVTHIMGLRAFSSQLLCEQVVGRGLRRTSYETDHNGLFEPEYVNIFGVPFTFLPHEQNQATATIPPNPKTEIKPDPNKSELCLSWPNIIRIEHTYKPTLSLDLTRVQPLALDPYEAITEASLAAIIAGKPNLAACSDIDLKMISEKFRFQTIVFETAKRIYNSEKPNWPGNKDLLLAQIIRITEQFVKSDKIFIDNVLFWNDEIRRRILIMLNLNKILQHIWRAIRFENTQSIEPVFDHERTLRSTADMRTWYTSKPNEKTLKSHINFCVFDSTWEASEAYILDRHQNVRSWVKNDHIGFAIAYSYQGVISKYYPDFLIQLKNNNMLILETKGQDTERDIAKREFLDEWIAAVNSQGGFGKWTRAVSYHPRDLAGILEKHF